jgi:nucleotide-binding universal stress UspA family protein
MLFSRVLVPLDGSERAERVLSQVARLLRREAAELILVRSVFTPPSLARIDTAALEAEHRHEAEAYLEMVRGRLAERGILARSQVPHGPAETAILETARRENVSLIAMSTHGRSGLSRWALGSVAERVVRSSKVPVLLLHSFRPDAKGQMTPMGDGLLPFRRLLVPLDGSDEAREALGAAEAFAQLFEAEIMLLHVQGTGKGPDLDAEAGRLRQAGLRAAVRWVDGHDVAGRILDEAEAEGADLIVMATHGRSGLSRWLMGSVAERVLRASGTPLLVVRPAAQAAALPVGAP